MNRVMQSLVFVFVAAFLGGCASTGAYFADRGRDAADILTIAGGVGAGAKGRVGPFALGLIYHREVLGLRGGSPYTDFSFDHVGDFHLALLGYECFSPQAYAQNIWSDRNKIYYTPYIIIPMPVACPSSQKFQSLAYLTQIEAVVGLGPSFRIGFNPGELLDFLLGWFTLDIFSDDIESHKSNI